MNYLNKLFSIFLLFFLFTNISFSNESVAYIDIDFILKNSDLDKKFLEEINRVIVEVPEAGIYGCNYFQVKNKQNKASKVGLPENFKSGYINYFKTYIKILNII